MVTTWLPCGREAVRQQGPALGTIDGTLAPHEYLSVMESSPSVMEMTRNPFVLRLFVDALPAILASRTGRSTAAITRYDIYSSFVKQWFGREVQRLPPEGQATLGVGAGGKGVAPVVELFELLCALLAGEMLKAGMLSVSFEEGEGEPKGEGEGAQGNSNLTGPSVWRSVQDVAGMWLVEDGVIQAEAAAAFRALPALQQRRYKGGVEAYVQAAMDARVDFVLSAIGAFATTCPLRKCGPPPAVHPQELLVGVLLCAAAPADCWRRVLWACLPRPADHRRTVHLRAAHSG